MSAFKLFVAIFVLHLCSANIYSSTPALRGRVTDVADNSPLPGATITVPELRISVTSNEKGEYSFPSIPQKGRFLIEVKYIGYKTISRTIDLSNPVSVNFALERSVIEVHEVVITGTVNSASNEKNSTSVAVINKQEMLRLPSNNIIDAISRIPGVSQITTGAAVSKPVIRGLSYNRVITLADGVKQEGQQWGDEHGIEVDQYNADRVEILRGAASLLYGSDAMGGVINIIDPLPPAEGQVKGELLTNYATNNGLTSSSAMMSGNTKGFVWRLRGTYKNAYGYNTPQYRLPNSGFNERNVSGQLGLNKGWGYVHLNLSSFNQKLGLPEFSINEDGEFVQETEEGEALLDPAKYKSRDLLLPFQDIRHNKAAVNSFFIIGESKLRANIAYQNNQRRELEESGDIPSLFFDLKTYSYDFKYYLPERNGWEPAVGISGAFQNNTNKAAELLIPDYDSKDFGAFAYVKRTWEKTTVNAGLRFDLRDMEARQMWEGDELKFAPFSNNFSNLSGAVGFTHEFNARLNLKFNAGTAFRAPNIGELSADGRHEGTNRIEKGNVTLEPERSFYTDVAVEYHTGHVDIHLNGYFNKINNYIYLRQLNGETQQEDNLSFPVYRYVQDKADLYGMEAGLTLHPSSLVHLDNTFSITRARNRLTDSALPFTPAPVLRNELRFEPSLKKLQESWISLGLDNFFRQDQVDEEFETTTGAYTLVNASAGTTIKLGRQPIRLSISGRNLLDKEYIDHLSRFKTDGFLNQGRNISFGVLLPLNFRKTTDE